MRQLTGFAAIALAASGCLASPAPVPEPVVQPVEVPVPARVTSVGLSVRPIGGGMGFITYKESGEAVGGHLSGDSPPFVHQDEGKVSPEVFAAIRAAADAVLVEPRPISAVPDADGTTSIDIGLSDNTAFHHVWTFREQPSDARVVALEKLLMEHRIGAW